MSLIMPVRIIRTEGRKDLICCDVVYNAIPVGTGTRRSVTIRQANTHWLTDTCVVCGRNLATEWWLSEKADWERARLDK